MLTHESAASGGDHGEAAPGEPYRAGLGVSSAHTGKGSGKFFLSGPQLSVQWGQQEGHSRRGHPHAKQRDL